MANFNWPAISVSASSGPIQFNLNGSATIVARDTVTPSNSIPLPVINLNSNGTPQDVALDFGASSAAQRVAALLGNASGIAAFGAGVTSAQVLRVVLPTDQTAIPASQSGTWNINNISGTVSLPTGASTAALQTTGNTSLSSIDTKTLSAGQKVMASSYPVVIASDQSAVPSSQSGTWNITNISGTVSLPTGAATSALQTTGNTSLNTIATNTPAVGQATMAASSPVVIASNQSNLPANITQVGGSTLALGQTTMSASIPVTFASNQSNLNISSGGKSKVNIARNDYGSTNVTTGAYVQIIASTAATSNLLEIFDSSGQTLVLAVGAAASEVDQFYINPGGNGQVPFLIPSGSRVSIKAVTATASAGYINLSLYS